MTLKHAQELLEESEEYHRLAKARCWWRWAASYAGRIDNLSKLIVKLRHLAEMDKLAALRN